MKYIINKPIVKVTVYKLDVTLDYTNNNYLQNYKIIII